MTTQTLDTTVPQVSADVDALLAAIFPPAPTAPYYGGLKYTAAWWAARNGQRG